MQITCPHCNGLLTVTATVKPSILWTANIPWHLIRDDIKFIARDADGWYGYKEEPRYFNHHYQRWAVESVPRDTFELNAIITNAGLCIPNEIPHRETLCKRPTST